jgi:hypothetical protein
MVSGKDRLLGRLAMLGPIAFTAAWLIAGLADDEYSVRQEDISALAALDAQHPWIMITGFLLLWRRNRRSRAWRHRIRMVGRYSDLSGRRVRYFHVPGP